MSCLELCLGRTLVSHNSLNSLNAVCSGGANLALPVWAIAAIIIGGLLILGLLVIVAIKLILFWLVS